MKFIFSFLLIFACVTTLFAGDIGRFTHLEPVYQPAVQIGSANSLNFAHIGRAPVANIALANPAALFGFKSIRAGVRLVQASAMQSKPFEGITTTTQTAYGFLPTAAALVVPWNGFRLGLAYERSYSTRIDYGEIPVITIQNPNGTGETHRPISETNIYTLSALGAYRLEPNLVRGDQLTLGISVRENFLKKQDVDYRAKGSASASDINWSIGSFYSMARGRYGLGLVFEKSRTFSGVYNVSGLQSENQAGNILDAKMVFKQPDVLRGGFSLRAAANLRLSATYNYYLWQNISESTYKNRMAYSVGMIYTPASIIPWIDGLNLGFYRSIREDKSTGFSPERELSFISAGARFNISDWSVLLQLRDSHLLGQNVYRQTSASVELEYALPY